MLQFSDGIEVDTSGDWRTLHLKDGWYVVGHGCLIPVENEEMADDMVSERINQD